VSTGGSLLVRHGVAWNNDATYRRAWMFGPQAAGLLVIGYLFTANVPPNAPPSPPGWVHPIDNRVRYDSMKTLAEQAKKDPASKALLELKANNGDLFAQFFMGILADPTIDRANGSAERLKTAQDWYRKAADQGLPIVQSNLGNLLAHERFGVVPDYAEAFVWLDKAAPKTPAAQRELGLLYQNGRGVPKDSGKGLDLIRSAADRGDPVAQTVLGDALDHGREGLAVDHHEAALLFQKAALQNNVFAERQLAIHLRNGDGIEADPAKARFWFEKAAAGGDAYAKAQLSETGAASPSLVSPFSFAPIKP
jgi:TPR repeat protein